MHIFSFHILMIRLCDLIKMQQIDVESSPACCTVKSGLTLKNQEIKYNQANQVIK